MSQSASSRRKGGLGRGLASLIPTAPVDGSSAPAGRVWVPPLPM
ncbi:hypothetical protein I540_5771 [Mycobacteroides abscessus subsp. bolletii 1513]|uniref:Uncharacterized protein n=1 Tax=Mycobacteroides abscessus subsp. bolletii 1513 TaxID=1299321 RepID=X8DDP9_9MYCO|nr:hypothetical protein I540_5771 [Mycobacteroides abscessus subsp. bolletii 1513]